MTDPIKAKIQELCPDVMKVQFGCEFEDVGIYIAKTPDDQEYYFAPKETDVNGDAQVFCVEDWHTKNLGSPITLAVVLRAIQKAKPEMHPLYVPVWLGETSNFYALWKLKHDNYDQQSEECGTCQ